MNVPDKRPDRLRIINQFGLRQALDDSPGQHLPLPGGNGLLLLGLGPSPAALAATIGATNPVGYLEAPDFSRQMPASWFREIPECWRKISPEDLHEPELLRRKALFYRPNLRLFPDFWAPILAAKSLERVPLHQASDRKTVWMPATRQGLLVNELSRAFARAGLHVHLLPQDLRPAECAQRLHEQRPDLFFCINFQGLDPFGQNAAALDHLDIPVAVWCVDNPFHLLPALKSTFWQRCRLFVTDDWFIRPLEDHGARQVCHLPLAADPDSFHPRGAFQDAVLAQKIVFVGRSSFPDKNAFFAGCSLPHPLASQAKVMMDQGRRPDFAWWWEKFGYARLWPGQAVRQIGFAAEQCSRSWRAAGLTAAAASGRLAIFGDPGWRSLLPDYADLRPEVDYYGPLADIYRQAGCTLNLTSLLLPRGLTQRHFDVWTAGGFLLTDATPGLHIFDKELVRESVFASPGDLMPHLRRLDNDPDLAKQIRTAWQHHILENHTYAHRVTTILDILGLQP